MRSLQTLGGLVQVLLQQQSTEMVPARGLACILLRQALESSAQQQAMDAAVIDYGAFVLHRTPLACGIRATGSG